MVCDNWSQEVQGQRTARGGSAVSSAGGVEAARMSSATDPRTSSYWSGFLRRRLSRRRLLRAGHHDGDRGPMTTAIWYDSETAHVTTRLLT